jgi:cytochrome c biogenesis factor
VVREAHEIQPLVPALKSWWMKLHVPANFIGYGTFALAAMVAFAYLIKQQARRPSGTSWRRCGCWAWCCASSPGLPPGPGHGGSYWMVYFGISALIVAGILRPASALPHACRPSRCWTT